MKLFILTNDLSDGGPIWMNVLWPMLQVFAECFDVTLLQLPQTQKPAGPRVLARLRAWRIAREQSRTWAAEVPAEIDPNGPNLLMVWAATTGPVTSARALEPVWDLFSHRILHIIDTVQPKHISPEDLARFDLVTCFCSDLAEAYAARGNRPTLFFPAHVDTLTFHNQGAYRPLDLLLVGRRDHHDHLPLYTHFNAPERDRIFVDLVTRGQTPMTREQEFRLLMSAHGKAAAVFCYEPGSVPRFCGRSPLLERWVHGWISGCTVFGTRPHGSRTEDLMNWPESMIDLPRDPREAIDLVEATLSDAGGMALRRSRNVLEAVRRHDTRYRIEQMLRTCDLPIPPTLEHGLDRLATLASELDAGCCHKRANKSQPEQPR